MRLEGVVGLAVDVEVEAHDARVPVQVAEQLLLQRRGRRRRAATLFRSSAMSCASSSALVCASLMIRLRVRNMRPHDATPTVTATLTAISQILVRIVTVKPNPTPICRPILGGGGMVRLGWNRGVGLAAALALAGCYEWAPVRPTELPKLSAGARELETADGGRFEVRRPVTAKVITPLGAAKFAQPRAEIAAGMLTIEGDDGAAHIPLDQITSVRVGQLSVVDTTASIVVLGAALTASLLSFFALRGQDNTDGGIK